ncbi:hypothetical protein ABKN59_009968 [Abortiporus biennis]
MIMVVIRSISTWVCTSLSLCHNKLCNFAPSRDVNKEPERGPIDCYDGERLRDDCNSCSACCFIKQTMLECY